ncbi:MAG: hypothetical protein ACKOW0_02790 [Schleiferiaceae bacterium]
MLVDTNYQNSVSFQDDLGRYFTSRHPHVIVDGDRVSALIEAPGVDGPGVFPEFLDGRVASYATRAKEPFAPYLDDVTGEAIQFDFDRDYAHRLLVHHQEGGGNMGHWALARLRLRAEVQRDVRRALETIDGDYDAVHVRHTDYQSDYGELMDWLKTNGRPTIYLATDSEVVVSDFRKYLPGRRIFNFSSMLSFDGTPIHLRRLDIEGARRRNMESLRDLMLLCRAGRIFYTLVKGFQGRVYPSGYTTLALNLRKRPAIIRALFGQ